MIQKTSDNSRPYDYKTMDDVIEDLTTLFQNSSESGSQGLSETLATGNETDGNDIKLSDGDKIFNSYTDVENDTDLISGLELDPAGNTNGNRFFSEDLINARYNEVYLGTEEAQLRSFDENYSSSVSANFVAGLLGGNDSCNSQLSVTNLGGTGSAVVRSSVDLVTDESTILLSSDLVKIVGLPTYADNAAAVSGGLAVNTVYKTSTGELRIVI